MRPFALYCALILALFTVAKYQGYALFGATDQRAAAGSSTRSGGGSSGSHK